MKKRRQSSNIELNEVRGAGFKRHKKKNLDDVSENTRAGLQHKKNKKEEGVIKAKRHKPLALKHKRRMIKAAVALTAVAITALSLFGYGFFVGKKVESADGQYYTVSMKTPNDGSVPTEHTGVENIGYMNYVLHSQSCWSSEMTSDIDITAVGLNIVQKVETSKQFYNDVLISSEITTSSMVNSATQFCVISDPDVVIWRESKSSDPKTYNGKDTEWSEDTPSGLSREEYRKTRGCVQDEFAVYIINENTILESSETQDNGDGTYSQTFKLNPEVEPPENSAVYYYRYQMYTTGGLTDLPTFNYITVTYTFDSSWHVLRSEIEENYVAKMGPINANGTARSVTEYNYEESNAKNSYYEDFFKQYETNFGTPAETGITASGCLSAAFAGILTGEARLAVDLSVDGKPASGLVTLDINKGDIRAEIGNIKVYVRDEDGVNYLYISYGDNFKAKAALSAAEQPAAMAETEENPDMLDAVLQQLGAGEFTVSEDQTSAALSTELDLGKILGTDKLQLVVPLNFTFNVADGGKEVSLGKVSADLELLGSDIQAELAFTESEVPALDSTGAAEYVDLGIAENILPLIGAEAITADLNYQGNGIDIGGEVTVNLKPLAVAANLDIVLNGNESARKNINVIYDDGVVYLTLGDGRNAPAALKGSVKDIMACVMKLLAQNGGQDGQSDVNIIAPVLEAVGKIDLGNLINNIIAERQFANYFSLTGGELAEITIDGTNLLKTFGFNAEIGEIKLGLGGGKISLGALGLTAEISADEAFTYDGSAFAEAADLAAIVDNVLDLVSAKAFSVDGNIALNVLGTKISLNIENLAVNLADTSVVLNCTLIADGAEEHVTLNYDGAEIKITLGDKGVKLAKEDLGVLADSLLGLLGGGTENVGSDGGQTAGALDGLLAVLGDFNVGDLINKLQIGGEDGAIVVEIAGVRAELRDLTSAGGLIGFDLSFENDIVSLDLSEGRIGDYAAPASPDPDIEYFDISEISPLFDAVGNAITEEGITLNGEIKLAIEEKNADNSAEAAVTTEISADVTLSVGWKEGIKVYLAADVTLDGKLHRIQADYNGSEFTLIYDDICVKATDFNGFIQAVKRLNSAINPPAPAAEADGDLTPGESANKTLAEKLSDILGKLSKKGFTVGKAFDFIDSIELGRTAAGNMTVTYGGFAAEIVEADAGNSGFAVTFTYDVGKNIALTDGRVEIKAGYASLLPAVKTYFNGDKLIPLIDGAADIVSKGGITLSGSADIQLKDINIGVALDNLSIKWKNDLGEDDFDLKLKATLTLNGVEHTLTADGNAQVIKLTYDNVGVKLESGAGVGYGDFIDSVKALVLAATASPDGTVNATVTELLGMLDSLSGGTKITAAQVSGIINDIALSRSSEGDLLLGYKDFSAKLLRGAQGEELASVEFAYGTVVTGKITLGEYSAPKLTYDGVVWTEARSLLPLMDNITEVITNKGITLSATINLPSGSTPAALKIYSLSVDWANGVTFNMDARLAVGSSVHDIYAEFGDNVLKIVYGALDENPVGVQLNFTKVKKVDEDTKTEYEYIEDVATLEQALISLYNRVANVVNTIYEGEEEILSPVDNLQKLLETLGIVKNASNDGADIVASIKDKFTAKNIIDIINKAKFSAPDGENGILEITVDKIGIGLYLDGNGVVSAVLNTENVQVELENLKIEATSYSNSDYNLENLNLLSAEDLADALDYVAAAVEMLAKDNFGFTLSGDVTTDDAAYSDQNGVKYNLDVTFDYSMGTSGFPLHLNLGESVDAEGNKIPWGERDINFWISPDMYAHLTVNMLATKQEEDSVLFDIYILDANPTITDGKTAAIEADNISTDNGLDVYMSVGRIKEDYTDSDDNAVVQNPVKIYAPVEEIMTVLSAGLAMVDVGGMNISEDINAVLKEVGGVIDTLLVDKYLTYTKDQFSSLGSSLLNTILGKPIDQTIAELLQKLQQKDETTTEKFTVKDRAVDKNGAEVREGALDVLTFTTDKTTTDPNEKTEGTPELTVKVGQTTATVTKEQPEGSNSRLTNIHVDSAPGSNGESYKDFNVDMRYDDKVNIEYPQSDYYNLEGIDTLLQAIVNSATHAEGLTTSEDSAPTINYELNKNFFITGSLTLNIPTIVKVTINIEGLSVKIEEKPDGGNNILLDARISYEGASGLGIVTAIMGNTTVDISIRNGMVYLKRVQTTETGLFSTQKPITPITIYRAMPMETFTADIMNQLFFVLNLNTNLINTIMGMVGNTDSTPAAVPKQDYGTQLADYLKSFTATEDKDAGTASWKITLNGTGINRLAGMSGLISDGTYVQFNATKDNSIENDPLTRYIINSLEINGKMLSAFNIAGNLKWENPKNVYNEGQQETQQNLLNNAPCNNFEKWLGVSGEYTLEDIKANVDWDNITNAVSVETQTESETITTVYRYLEISFSGEEAFENINSDIRLGNLSYYLVDISGEETLLGESQTVLFKNSDNKIYTLNFVVPDVSEYEKLHYTLKASEIIRSGASLRINYTYIPDVYSVTINSEREFPKSVDTGEGYTYQYQHTYGTPLDFDFAFEIRSGEHWYRIDHITINGVDCFDMQSVEITEDNTQISVVWTEIPHTTVTVFSDKFIEGFTEADGGYTKDFEVETGVEVDMFAMIGNVQSVGGYVFTGLQFDDGSPANSINVSAPTKINAVWEVPTINVKFISAVQADGFENDGSYAGDEYDNVVYTSSKSYKNDYSLSGDALSQSGKTFLGWFYKGADGWIKVDDLLNDIPGSEKFTQTVELHAVWASATVEGSGTYSVSWFVNYTYTLKASMELTLDGAKSIINSFKASATFEFAVAGKNASGTAEEKEIAGNGTFDVSNIKPESTIQSANSGTVTVTYTVKFNDVQVCVGEASANIPISKA